MAGSHPRNLQKPNYLVSTNLLLMMKRRKRRAGGVRFDPAGGEGVIDTSSESGMMMKRR